MDPSNPSLRYRSIDVMRTLAITFMILCHGIIFTSSPEPGQEWTHFFGNHFVGDFAAPIFTFLVGVSLAISLSRATPSHAYKRGIALFLIGMVYGTIGSGLRGILGWDVLPFIGTSILILTFLRKKSNRMLLSTALGVLLLAPIIRKLIGYQEIWGNQFIDVPGLGQLFPGLLLDPESYPKAIFSLDRFLTGWLSYGYFGVFPWIIFPLTGFVVGRHGFLEEKFWIKSRQIGTLLCLSGVTLAWFARPYGASGLNHFFLTPFSFYPNTTSMIVLQLGICLSLISFLHKKLDFLETRLTRSVLISFCSTLSRFALTLYVSHKIILVTFKKGATLLFQLTPEKVDSGILTPHQALLFAVILLLLLMSLAHFCNRLGGKYSLEGWLKKLD